MHLSKYVIELGSKTVRLLTWHTPQQYQSTRVSN